MDPDPSSSLLIIGLALVASAFFSGMEIAFVSANRLQLELDSKSSWQGRILTHLSSRTKLFIATMLVGNNLALVIFGLESGALIANSLFGVADWESASSPMGALAAQTALSTLVVLVTAEFLPKSFFHGAPNRWLRFFSLPLVVAFYILWPLAIVVLTLSRLFLGKKTDEDQADGLSAVDLDDFVRGLNERMVDEDDSSLDNELQILQNAMDFSNLKARDCLVPRNEIVALEASATVEELEAAIEEMRGALQDMRPRRKLAKARSPPAANTAAPPSAPPSRRGRPAARWACRWPARGTAPSLR